MFKKSAAVIHHEAATSEEDHRAKKPMRTMNDDNRAELILHPGGRTHGCAEAHDTDLCQVLTAQ
ncbi:hypothetical protein CCR75_004618 [Bremia lactucae]|uniref:Uncharacterized protein n=1 Tax=Bremia lactucae TaxID=4779 RepID=A0A976IM01_BRELC|nr:hypothetical protein CCR75_004618 [Bremia lactucae]